MGEVNTNKPIDPEQITLMLIIFTSAEHQQTDLGSVMVGSTVPIYIPLGCCNDSPDPNS